MRRSGTAQPGAYMLKSDLIERIAAENPHLYQRDVEVIVNTILGQTAKVRLPRLCRTLRPAPQAGCFVSRLSVSCESQITLRHRAFGTVAGVPSSTVHDTFSSPGRNRCSATWRLNAANTEQSRASGRRLSRS